MRRSLGSLLVAASLTLLVSCTSDAADTAEPVSLDEFVPPTAPRDRDTIAEDLAAAQERWNNSGIMSYELEHLTRCVNCLVDGGTDVITVSDGRITSERNTSSVYPGLPSLFDSVDQVFVAIDEAAAVGLVLDATFDDELGYPTMVIISSEFADRQTDTEIAPFAVSYTLR